ncbi:uncharacterized protein A4U43_C04F14300 [Asparagus officinalis]|uniref:AMP-dependent synthetase/ligase domain-containing protein n=1 Tax=Asparagus officinalis TaxID=4686 RepID=A0A5P1F5G7_ASPOF|nr:uncharacterized protein A4U43_C04F14300 [Asparagus officinalis]
MFQRKGLQVQLFEGILHLNGFILIFKWGSLKVRWDEHANIQRPKRVKGGTNVVLHNLSETTILSAIADHGVTHLAGTTPVLNMITNADEPIPRHIDMLLGEIPPPPYILHKMEDLGYYVIHYGGQTEMYCCAVYGVWQPEWDTLLSDERARLKSQ